MNKWFIMFIIIFECNNVFAQEPKRSQIVTFPISVQHMIKIVDSTRTVSFLLSGTVEKDSLQPYSYNLRVIKDNSIYWIQPNAIKCPGTYYIRKEDGKYWMNTVISFVVERPCEYSFRFWQTDSTTIDTTLTFR